MQELKENILNFVKTKGPVIPIQISKLINSDIFLASALLSELTNSKQIKSTKAVIGSSHVYYAPGQESKIGNFLYPYLKEREKQAYALIKEKKVLKNSELEPWQRVALNDLKDFAVLLEHTSNEKMEFFWKFYLTPNEEAESLIKRITMPIIKEELQQKLVSEEIKEKKREEEKAVKPKKVRAADSDFFNNVRDYIEKNKINIASEETIRKNKEINFSVKIPSPIGELNYLVKAKSKKTISEADISLAYSESQQRKLPVILFINGKVNKKAEKLIKEHSLIIKTI